MHQNHSIPGLVCLAAALLALAADLRFTMTTGQARTLPMPAALLHVFNHATHHRGQITAAISMLGFGCQPLDLPHLIFAEQAVPKAP